MGAATVELADQIIRARAHYNETIVLHGANSPEAFNALTNLNALQKAGKELMAA